MDWTAVGAITASISTAREIAKGLSATRDQSLINEKTSALLDQLLKAQEGLLTHNAALLQLQGENFKTSEELRELKETMRERGRYSLVSIGNGYFAYRVNITPQQSGASEPSTSEPLHYVCQTCFDSGVKSVIQPRPKSILLECPRCKIPMHANCALMYPA